MKNIEEMGLKREEINGNAQGQETRAEALHEKKD